MDLPPTESLPPVPEPVDPPTPPAEPGGRIGPAVAWAAIVLVVAAIIGSRTMLTAMGVSEGPGSGAIVDRLFLVQSKLLAGAADMSSAEDRLTAYRQLKPFDDGGIRRRQQLVVMAWEMAGPDETARRLAALDDMFAAATGDDDSDRSEPTDEDRAAQQALRTLYGGADPPAVDALEPADRAALVDGLGWFGELALVPSSGDRAARDDVLGPLQFVALLVGVLAITGLVVGVLGFAGLITWAALAFSGRLRSGLAGATPHGGVYVETFALWLVVFFVLQIVMGLVAGLVAPKLGLLAAGFAFLLSLAALAWPGVRGVPWADARRDIGIHFGRGGWREPFWGVACYAMSLPIIAAGVLMTLLLMALAGLAGGGEFTTTPAPEDTPAHPIILQIVEGGWFMKAQVLLVACIAAPIVEEIFFRGLLYRHLRESTRGWGTAGSILLGTLVNAFVFAVIHPQGLLAVPALMSIATGLTLAREWRGSLVPSMVMHGLNNGIAMTLLMVVMGA